MYICMFLSVCRSVCLSVCVYIHAHRYQRSVAVSVLRQQRRAGGVGGLGRGGDEEERVERRAGSEWVSLCRREVQPYCRCLFFFPFFCTLKF